MGCFKRLIGAVGCLVIIVAACLAAWMYRDRAAALYRRLRGVRPPPPLVYATPARGGAARVDSSLALLARRGGPAYVDLTAGDLAALLQRELGEGGGSVVDSIAVALGDGRVSVKGSLDVSRLPRRLLGPLAEGLGRREPVLAAGRLEVDSLGRLVWTIDELKVRDFPFPGSVIPSIIKALGLETARGAAVPIPLPKGIGDVRVSPARVRAYRASRR